jgi:hypothetical protein
LATCEGGYTVVMSSSEPRDAEYLVLQWAAPGKPVQAVGVLLFDRSQKTLYWRIVEHWADIAGSEDAEVLSLLGDSIQEQVGEVGAEAFLSFLEETLSNVLLVGSRQSIRMSDVEATLEELFRENVHA